MPNYWFDHVHLISPDPKGTAEFYENILGSTKVGVRETFDGRTLIDMVLNGTAIRISPPKSDSLLAGISNVVYGIEHFGLETDDINKAVDDLKSKGVKFVQEITPGRGAFKVAFFLGPQDALIELIEREN